MSKKEKIFPLNTVGGKIQNRRHELNLSRSQLYDLMYGNSIKNGRAGSDSSKEKAVYNWESEKTQLDYYTLPAICKALQCSSDYLLGLDECTNKTNQFIHDEIGLTEKSIEILRSKYYFSDTKNIVALQDFFGKWDDSWIDNMRDFDTLNILISEFNNPVKDVLHAISAYLFGKNPDKTYYYDMDTGDVSTNKPSNHYNTFDIANFSNSLMTSIQGRLMHLKDGIKNNKSL